MTSEIEVLHPGVLPLIHSHLDFALTPPSRLSLSAWAERNIVLSSEYAALASELHLFGWQKKILDSFTDPAVMDITLMCGRQLIKTLFIQCAMAYVICEDPGPILLVEPTDTDAKDFSRERLLPMVRDCFCLHGKISTSSHEGKLGSNRLQAKDFPGGNLSLVGAGAPGNLARRSIRYLFCDEVDKYDLDLKGEGDPIYLAWESAATFQSRRKRIMCCTPTILGRSRIGKAYADSNQSKPLAPCWKCGFPQILHFWPDAENSGGVIFDTSVSREKQAETAYYQCANCDHQWNDRDRKRSANASTWTAFNPLVTKSHGFWISHLYSPWKSLSEIVQTYLDTKDTRSSYKTFVNCNLAIEWREDGETPDAEVLYGLREDYPHGDEAVVPRRGLLLTASVDVQESPPRLEVEVQAWGRGRENWSIYYGKIEVFAENGQPLPVTSVELWDKLNADILQRNWLHESGQTMSIMVMAIDTGRRPKPVYDFARRHPQLTYSPGVGLRLRAIRTVMPVKGTADMFKILSSQSPEDAIKKHQGVRIISVGTHCAKQEIYDSLKHIRPKTLPDRGGDGSLSGLPSHGAYHFPRYDMEYFKGLCSEVLVIDDKTGKAKYEQRYGRNEPIDLKVYGRAAAAACGVDRMPESEWRRLEDRLKVVLPSSGVDPVPAASAPFSPHTGGDASAPTPTSPSVPPSSSSSPPPPPHAGVGSSLTRRLAVRPSRGGFL